MTETEDRRENVRRFKRIARNYLRTMEQIERLSREIEGDNYMLQGVRSIDTSMPKPAGRGQKGDRERLYRLMDHRDELIRQRNELQKRIGWTEKVIEQCNVEYRPYITTVFIRRAPLTGTAEKLGMPWERLSRKISEALQEVLSDEMMAEHDEIMRRLDEEGEDGSA